MKSVWVVIGETGEYSDRREWCVAAFGNEEAAEAFAKLCREEGGRAWEHYKRNGYDGEGWQQFLVLDKAALELGAEPGFPGYEYSVVQVEFRE